MLRLAFAIGCAALFLAAGTAAGASSPRAWILYASDWSGPTEIFAADPSGRSPVRQVTFGRPEGACYAPVACGFTDPLPSPDGRELAYWTVGFYERTLWLARADGTGAREVGAATDAAWTPDSKQLVYSAADGIRTLTTNGVDRIVGTPPVGSLVALPKQARGDAIASTWSLDRRTVAYATRQGIFLAPTRGGSARAVYRFTANDLYPVLPRPFALAFAPGGRLLAFNLAAGIRLLDLRTGHVRRVSDWGGDLAWSSDGKELLYVQSGESSDGDSISAGDVRAVTPDGHVRVLLSHSASYGGQIVAAAWTTPPHGVSYRAPAPVDGIFAGGPVQELATDGGRVAFIACAGVSVWTPTTGAVTFVARQTLELSGRCFAPYSRGHLYSVAIAGDRVAWIEKGWGLGFHWDARAATIGSAPVELAGGSGTLGTPPLDGLGTAVGSGSLLVVSGWKLHWAGSQYPKVDVQTIERVDAGACPCTALSSSPGPYTPLDVDAGRIVVSGDLETRILAADGTILLALPVPTQAAQLSGSQLVLAVGSGLRVYDTDGVLRAAWPLPAGPIGHACDGYGDPSCRYRHVVLGDVAHGLAAYSIDGEIHLLRLADGVDRDVGPGVLPRFADGGLVFADGARIRLVPLP
jgi:hypothetical protein